MAVLQIEKDIYQIEVPLPGNPLRALNSYFIRGKDRNLLIDTGFNRKECYETHMQAYDEIDADLSNTDIFITHLHADHSGLLPRLVCEGMTVYASREDGEIINAYKDMKYWRHLEDIFETHGMPSREADQDHTRHPGELFGGRPEMPFTYVAGGDEIVVGDYKLRCLMTPGHTPGHMCLYDEEKKILFSGDHILDVITPNITPEIGMDRPLGLYFESLKRISSLDATRIYTGHRTHPTDLPGRVKQLLAHHDDRLDEIMNIIKGENKPMCAYDIAKQMTWHVRYENFYDFPRQQRWFATGEAISHVLYLEDMGKLKCTEESGVKFYDIQ